MKDLILSVSEAYEKAYREEKTEELVRKPAEFPMSDSQFDRIDGQIEVGSFEYQKIVMWQHLATLLTPSIKQMTQFAKELPGFDDLDKDDILVSLKLGCFPVWLVHAAGSIHPQEGITFRDGSFISRQQMEIIFDQEFVTLLFNFACWFNNLQLNDSATALYSAIVLFLERDCICKQECIQRLQQKFMDALDYQLNQDCPNEPHMFLTLLSKLPELCSLTENHLKQLQWFTSKWTLLQLPELFAEVYDIPTNEAKSKQLQKAALFYNDLVSEAARTVKRAINRFGYPELLQFSQAPHCGIPQLYKVSKQSGKRSEESDGDTKPSREKSEESQVMQSETDQSTQNF